ncbi:hypothetical protein MXB_2403, partial [Myxobolus squamalis]
PQVLTQILRELQLLHQWNSPYIVGYFGAFQAEGAINILMEYMDWSVDKIFKKVKRIPEGILSKITEAVIYFCYKVGSSRPFVSSYQSSDIKPSNILINSNGEIKICDFSVNIKLIDSMAATFIGTRSYMAPERFKGSEYTVQSDIWSLGIFMVELVTGRYPYPPIPLEKLELFYGNKYKNPEQEFGSEKDLSIFELLECIVECEPPKLLEPFFSHEICNFVCQWSFISFKSSLKKLPDERADLESLIEHEFLKKHVD